MLGFSHILTQITGSGLLTSWFTYFFTRIFTHLITQLTVICMYITLPVTNVKLPVTNVTLPVTNHSDLCNETSDREWDVRITQGVL